MSRRALVTGSEGFTGRYVCQELARHSWEVWHTELGRKPKTPNHIQIDLLNPSSLSIINDHVKPDVVIHLAAASFANEDNVEVFYKTNVIGTRNLLDALTRGMHRPSCTIIASSATIYGKCHKGAINETNQPRPVNDYGVSKAAVELVAKTFENELDVVITRPFNYTGVGQDKRFFIPKLISHFKARKATIELGNLDVARDFSDVRDVASVYRLLAEEKPIGETLNICSGEATPLVECINMASDITAHNIDVLAAQRFRRQNEISELRGCPKKLREIIDFTPNFSLRDTIKWMLES